MKNQQNIDTFFKWLKLHQQHDVDDMLSFLSDDVTIKSAAGGKMPPATNKNEAAHHWKIIYSTFPDMRMEEISHISQDDVIIAKISHGGTMLGNMGEKTATGASYRVQGAFKFVFESGKIKSILSYWDPSYMLQQLGLIPEPEHA